MAGFKADTEVLKSAANEIASKKGEIQGLLARLQNTVDQVLATWKGETATKFSGIGEKFREDGTKINDALQLIGETLDKSAGVMRTQEEASGQLVGGFRSRLNS